MQTAQTTPNKLNHFNKTTSFPRAEKLGTPYENMVVLRRDLYYKEIINAHSERITALTESRITEIMYRYNKGYLSKKELFGELESMYSGYPCTDIPIKNISKIIRSKK